MSTLLLLFFTITAHAASAPTPAPALSVAAVGSTTLSLQSVSAVSGMASDATGMAFDWGYVKTGGFIQFNLQVAAAGTYDLVIHYASPGGNTGACVLLNTVKTATVPFASTGGWATYTNTAAYPLTLPAGQVTLQLLAQNSGFNIGGVTLSARPPPVSTAGWQMTFSDEFDNESQVNLAKWNSGYTWSPTVINQELQYYAPDAFLFLPSALRIRADQRAIGGQKFTSGALTTKNKFTQTYGYFEIRTQLPNGHGFWPAFWLIPQDGSQLTWEIDVFETLGQDPTTTHLTFHCNSDPTQTMGVSYSDASLTSGYHTYGVQWNPTAMIWYVDGVERFRRTTCVPNTAGYMLANLAIGGSWPVPPDSTTPFPSYMDIDYIRAYKWVSSGGISLAGPGAGMPLIPPPPPPPMQIVLGPMQATPVQTAAGSSVRLTASITAGPLDISNMNYSYQIYDASNNFIGSTYVGPVTIPAGQTQTPAANFKVPVGTPAGFYKVALNIATADWSKSVFWEGNGAYIEVK